MRIPEGEPFEVPQDQTGQEKPFESVMGKNHTPNPEHFSLFGQGYIVKKEDIYSLDEDTRGGIFNPEDGISQRDYSSSPANEIRPNYDEYDPYKPGNRERTIKSYRNFQQSAPPTDQES